MPEWFKLNWTLQNSFEEYKILHQFVNKKTLAFIHSLEAVSVLFQLLPPSLLLLSPTRLLLATIPMMTTQSRHSAREKTPEKICTISTIPITMWVAAAICAT